MAIIDLHTKPFDEQTLTKLELFEDYAKEWIPTFVMGGYSNIWIFDFFAGPGYDINSIAGSPIRILKQVEAQIGNIFTKQIRVNICLNEYEKDKYDMLKHACEGLVCGNPDTRRAMKSGLLNIVYYNEDFANLFPKLLPFIK